MIFKEKSRVPWFKFIGIKLCPLKFLCDFFCFKIQDYLSINAVKTQLHDQKKSSSFPSINDYGFIITNILS